MKNELINYTDNSIKFDYPDYIYKSYSSLEDYFIYREMCEGIRYSFHDLDKEQKILLNEIIIKNNGHLTNKFNPYLNKTLNDLLYKYRKFNWIKN